MLLKILKLDYLGSIYCQLAVFYYPLSVSSFYWGVYIYVNVLTSDKLPSPLHFRSLSLSSRQKAPPLLASCGDVTSLSLFHPMCFLTLILLPLVGDLDKTAHTVPEETPVSEWGAAEL